MDASCSVRELIQMQEEPVARGKHLSSKFAALSLSIPGVSAWVAKYNRATLPPIHIVIEDLLSITSDDVLPREKLPKFCALCSTLAQHPQSIGGQLESVLFRVAAFVVSHVTSHRSEASALCDSLCLLCCNFLSHLSQEEGTFSEHSAQSSLLQLLAFIADCMSDALLSAPFFECFGSKGFVSLLTFCEECTAHVLSVDISSEAGSSMLEYMWSIYLIAASIFVSAAAHEIDTSHFQNFICQVSSAIIITKDYLQLLRRTSDVAGVVLKIASVMVLRPQPNMVSSFVVQCIDVVIRLRTMYLSRGQVDILLSYLDCIAAISEYSGCACEDATSAGDVLHREGATSIEEALRTSTFVADEILPLACFRGVDKVMARWIADDLAFCSFVSEHFHEKILSKCAPTLQLLQRLNVLGFEQFEVLWMKAVNCLCDGTTILKTKFPEISQCLCIVGELFALRIVDDSVAAFASNSSLEIRVHHLKSLHILAHHRKYRVMDAVLNALWECICLRCQSSFDVEEMLEILQNARTQFCFAEFHLSRTMTLIPRLFSTLANHDSTIDAVVACQVLHVFIDSDACISTPESLLSSALTDSVKLFNSLCSRPMEQLSQSKNFLTEIFISVCQLMLTLITRQETLFSTDQLSSCFESLASPQFLYDNCLKFELFSLLVQVSLNRDSIQSALLKPATSHQIIDSFATVLEFLEQLSPSAVSDSLNLINKSMLVLPSAMKKQIYSRCIQSSVMEYLWKICFQELNKNLLNFFADVFVVVSDPHSSALSSDLHSGVSKLVASKIDSFSGMDVCDEMSCLLHIVKFALIRRPSDCCFGAVGLISPPVLICVHKEEPVMFQMASSLRSIQSTLCIGPCSMIVCDEVFENVALSVGNVIEQTHEDFIPYRLYMTVEAPNADFIEPVPLAYMPGILGPKFVPWLHTLAFSGDKLIQNAALDVCCLLPSFDSSLQTHLNTSVLDKFRAMASAEFGMDSDSTTEIFFSCFYACGLMASMTCNIGDKCAAVELSEAEVLFCSDFLSYCLSQLEGKSPAVWNQAYLLGILSSLHCLRKCSKSQLPSQFCQILLRLQGLFSSGGFSAEVKNLSSLENCPVNQISTCRGIINAYVDLAAKTAWNHPDQVFSQFLNVTLTSTPSAFLRSAYNAVALLIQVTSDRDALDSVITACLAVPLVCKTFEFGRSFKLHSDVVHFLSRHPDFMNTSRRADLLVSACRAIDSIDWSYCHSIRNGQTLINEFLHMCLMMLKISCGRTRNSTEFSVSVSEIVTKSFKTISCFVTADGGSCGLASFRGDASTLIQSVRVSLSQLFSRLVDIYSCFVPIHVIISVLAKNHQMYNPDFDLDSSAKQREFQAWPGFTNLGNTCYMNAVLQQLLSAPWFSHVLMSAKSTPAEDSLLYECQKMIANHFYSDLAVTVTRPLVDVSKIWGASIDCREPHDAQEYLMSLLDQVGSDMLAEDKENLDGLFHGEISSHVTHGCNHGHSSVMKGSFVCLSLNIDGIASIHDCIQSTLQRENIAVDCAQCNSLKLDACHVASKKDFISACPPILVIHLKRFLFDISSDSRIATVLKNVPSIPSVLDLTPFLSPNCSDLGLYDLHGMVLHVGSLEYGHYTSIFSQESPGSSKAREWLFADDHKVSVFSEDEMQSFCDNQGEEMEGPLPYLIFYKKRNAHVFPKFKSSVFTLSPGKTPPPKASMHAAFAALPKGEDILRRIETLVSSGKEMVSEEPKEISHLVASTVRHMKRSQASRFMYNAEYLELVCKLVRCSNDFHPEQSAELAVSYLLHVLAPHARPSQLHAFKVTYQVIAECFKTSEKFLSCILYELTKAKAFVSKFILGFRETFVEGLLFLQSVVSCAGAHDHAPTFNPFAEALFNSCLREIMQTNLPPVFLIHALLRTSYVPPDGKLALLALPLCKTILEACEDPDLSSDTNFNLLLDCGHHILTVHCIPAMSRLNKVEPLKALIPYLLHIGSQASNFCAAASFAAYPDQIALCLSSDLESAALDILDSSSFLPPQIVYRNTKAVLVLALNLWVSSGQPLLAATFHQLMVLKSRILPKNVFGVFAAFNQMTSDRRISQLLRDRAVFVEECIEWLLLAINLENPEESSDLFSISPFTSPQSERSGSDTPHYSMGRVESAATKLAASVRASLSFSSSEESSPGEAEKSPTFSETATNP